MTKDEALRLALEALEKLWNIIDDIDTYSDMAKADEKLYRSLVERRQRQRFEETGISTDGYELHGGAITAIKAALEAKDEPADNELRRLHDLLGKANALARIRAAEIESLKASLYGLYELEKQHDELKQRLTKTEGQLGEAVWNYGELKRELLANQQKTSGSPINSLTEADKIRNACPRTYNRCGYDAVAKKCVADGCAGPQNWAVFCGGCRKEWSVPYKHPGKSICVECEAKLHSTPPQQEAKDEPVAWVYPEFWQHLENLNCGTAYRLSGIGRQPLYITPPQRKPLTDEEIKSLDYSGTRIEFVRSIEAKLRSKND